MENQKVPTTSAQYEEKIGKAKQEISDIKTQLQKLDERKRALLIDEQSVDAVNVKINGLQTRHRDQLIRLEMLEKLRMETKEQEARAEREENIRKLQIKAREIKTRALESLGVSEEFWRNLRDNLNQINTLKIAVEQIKRDAQRLGTTVDMNLPELSTPVALFNSVHNVTVEAYYKRVRKQMEELEKKGGEK